ncbi:MAG TPA: hypothetical protein VMU43_09230 [Candidatus Acidoferrum sp.]|nr:hypothetical protein [Candidatus Acidoferrum sp.]
MLPFASHQRALPVATRVVAILFLLLWAPIYWHFWGPANFIFLCDIAVILGCLGLASGNPLLISSQAVSILPTSAFWTLDVVWHILFGGHIFSGAEYMFDPQYPLWLRLISLFHIALPLALLWALGRTGYDRRAFQLQCVVAILALLAARAAAPARNINFAFRDPFWNRQLGPAPLHLALIFLATALVLYLPVHLVLQKLLAPPARIT